MWAAIRLIRALWVFGWIFASYMFQLGLRRVLGAARVEKRWKKVHARNARRLYKGFVRLRGVYIKLGQILSIMGTFLPRVFTKELETLQDEVPQRPYRQIARAFERSVGKRPREVFASFSEEAVAAASLGQVHIAEDHEGRKLAVKVLYPNVETIIKVDLKVLRWALIVYRWFVPVRQIERVHEQLTDMLARETNYVHEAKCLARMAANFADDDDVLFPEVIGELSTDKVLTMSFMDGVKISRFSELERLELDPYDVADKLIKTFYKQLFLDRFFHADPHPGNFFVQRGPEGQPRIVILDLGAASEITDELATGMLTILGGVMGRDDSKVVEGIEIMGFVAEDGDRDLLQRATKAYFEKLLDLNITDFGKISPDVAKELGNVDVKKQELRELMKSVQYPLGWFFVERAVVIMFGLCATLAPKMNTMRVGFPYVMQMIATENARKAAAAATATSTATATATATAEPA